MSQPARERAAPPSSFRYFEIAFVVACVGLDARLAFDVVRGFAREPPSAISIVVAVTVAYLGCDLVAGLVHFVLDRFGTIDTPYVGRTFLLPFRSHHDHPDEIRDHDFVETNGNNAFGALILLVPFVALAPVHEGGRSTAVGVFVLVFTVLVLLTNQFHKWAHVEAPPRFVAWLQARGLLLSRELHEAHHDAPNGGGYCVTSGVWNRVLDPLGFFPAFERTIRFVLRLSAPPEPAGRDRPTSSDELTR